MFESRFFGVLFEGLWVENPKVSTGGFWCFSLKSSGAPNLRKKATLCGLLYYWYKILQVLFLILAGVLKPSAPNCRTLKPKSEA